MKLEKYLAEIEETVSRMEERKMEEGEEYNKKWFRPYYSGILSGIFYMSGRDLDINREDGLKILAAVRKAEGSI